MISRPAYKYATAQRTDFMQKSVFRGCDVDALQRNLSLLDACAVGAQRGQSNSSSIVVIADIGHLAHWGSQ